MTNLKISCAPVIFGFVALLGLSGCASYKDQGHARYVLVEKGSGVIAMPVAKVTYEDTYNRLKASRLIEAKCGDKNEIAREEEVSVQGATEYRIWYRCL